MQPFKHPDFDDAMQHITTVIDNCTRLDFPVTYDLAYNAAKVWIDLSCIPYHEHDAILDRIEDATYQEFTEGQRFEYASFMRLDRNTKLARALHSLDVAFHLELHPEYIIDESADEHYFAMHAIELKKWLEIRAFFVHETFVLPLDANAELYGIVCRFKKDRISDEQCKRLIDEITVKWMQLFCDVNAAFRFSKPEFIPNANANHRDFAFCAAFVDPTNRELIPNNADIKRNMHWISLEELGLIDCPA